MQESNGNMLKIDADHLYTHNKELYYQLINFPSDIIMLFDEVANTIFESQFQNQQPW